MANISATSNRNNTFIFDGKFLLIRSFKDEFIQQVILLENDMYLFACGRNHDLSEFEISCLNLEDVKQPIKTSFQYIDNFYQKSDIFTFYDQHNYFIYLTKRYENSIYCLNYNRETHLITLNQIIDLESRVNILHL